MNVQRLHKIISALKADLEKTNLIGVFGGLVSQLAQLSNDPNDTAHQTNVADSKKALAELLVDFPTNSYQSLNRDWFEIVSGASLPHNPHPQPNPLP